MTNLSKQSYIFSTTKDANDAYNIYKSGKYYNISCHHFRRILYSIQKKMYL